MKYERSKTQNDLFTQKDACHKRNLSDIPMIENIKEDLSSPQRQNNYMQTGEQQSDSPQ